MTVRVAAAPPLARHPLTWLLTGSLAILLVTGVVAVGLGPTPVPVGDTYRILVAFAGKTIPGELGDFLGSLDAGTSYARREVITGIRLPRVVLGAVVGAGLGGAGCVLQALLRNPLADPYLIGVSSGAGFGVVGLLALPMVLPIAVPSASALMVGAFAGGMIAFALVFGFARRARNPSPSRLILAGVAVGALFSAGTQWLLMSSPEESTMRRALSWMMGSLVGVELGAAVVPAIVTAAGVTVFLAAARWLDAFALGEEVARTVGLDVVRFRAAMTTLVAVLIGVLVSVTGPIGFVALVVPHAVRLLVGVTHRRLIALTVVWAPTFVIWADVLARTARPGQEVPLGVVTAVLGVPFFLAILRTVR